MHTCPYKHHTCEVRHLAMRSLKRPASLRIGIEGLLLTSPCDDTSCALRKRFRGGLALTFLALALALVALALIALAITRHLHAQGAATIIRLVLFECLLASLLIFELNECDATGVA